MRSCRRRIVTGGLIALVVAMSSPAPAAGGRINLEVPTSSGFQRGFDLETATLVTVTASSVDLRLGTNRTTGYWGLVPLNGAGAARLGTAVDYAALGCAELQAVAYSSTTVVTGPSPTTNPEPGTVYAARSRVDTFAKFRLVAIDTVAPVGLILDFETFDCAAVDSTPPVIAASVSGPHGNGSWYVGAVSVSWSVSDPESAVSSWFGCGPSTIGFDTAGTSLTCTATSAGGTSAQSVTVQVDATPPGVVYSGNAGTYAVNEQVTIGCDSSDATSGVASDTCVDVDAPAYSFGGGDHTLSAAATDVAGNAGAGSTTFTVVVDAAGLGALIDALVGDSGVASSLKSKVDAIFDAPNANAARGKIGALRNEIEAQTGKAIDEDSAEILLGLLDSL